MAWNINRFWISTFSLQWILTHFLDDFLRCIVFCEFFWKSGIVNRLNTQQFLLNSPQNQNHQSAIRAPLESASSKLPPLWTPNKQLRRQNRASVNKTHPAMAMASASASVGIGNVAFYPAFPFYDARKRR